MANESKCVRERFPSASQTFLKEGFVSDSVYVMPSMALDAYVMGMR
jgi:hypothetical protein